MAAGLIEIKRRIKSVTNTRKITKAMGLISTSKLRKCRINLEANTDYFNSFENVMPKIVAGVEGKSIYINGNGSKKKLFIAITSESGLCGGFNGAVVSETVEKVMADKENSLIMSVGQKGRINFKRLKLETVAEYVDIPDEPTLKEPKTIAEHALSLYRSGEIGEVYIIFTKFVSTVKQVVVTEKVLPFALDKEAKRDIFPEFEPEANDLLEGIVSVHLKSQLFNCLLNSKVSEQSARMSAMDSATKNANDLLDNLNLKYNRIRQSAITQEISEIVGGAEAQK